MTSKSDPRPEGELLRASLWPGAESVVDIEQMERQIAGLIQDEPKPATERCTLTRHDGLVKCPCYEDWGEVAAPRRSLMDRIRDRLR